MAQALGMIECRNLPAAMEAADVMAKRYPIQLMGYEKTGAGLITVFIEGQLQEVKKAIEQGVLAAEAVGEVISLHVIDDPHPSLLGTQGLTVSTSPN